ncbi:Gfo/Idh/MocA family protein [Paenibacillus agilis]|uniref:Gfo/Idh/MocA family oxidoreductase n=1 Tax=Paenibacillus agilis TaxID=3020863 RepID=A0A559II71_9BACL|nr:Gfo/Idh/MocA family oxidoreductase [Paenibacillus agilis]TVX87210.1 Gfo/Idh/MocA family oxidoreductase [Paenibacillus agilis]
MTANMERKLRVGVISTGGIFRGAHMPAFLANPHTEIVAVCDTHKPSACAVADEIGQVRVYTEWEEMLEQEELDIIDICSPNYLHAPLAIAALERGLHVFCEKPDAIHAEEALRMKEAAEKSGKVLMVMRNNRYRSRPKFLKQWIAEGGAGHLYTGRCGWIRRKGIPGKGGWFTTKELSGGGPLIDLGVHMIDLSMWLMGNPKPIAVTGATYSHFSQAKIEGESRHVEGNTYDVEDLATGFIRFDNGATLQVEVSWASHIEEDDVFVEMRGTKGGFSMRNETFKLFTDIGGQSVNSEPQVPIGGWGHQENVNHFVDAVLGLVEPEFTPDQGVDMIRILDAMYQSAREGREIRLD